MGRLPHNFPTDKLGVVERIQLEWFYTKFTEEYYNDYLYGHMVLAAYAAIPAYLTPDLLYKLRQNFSKYQWAGKEETIHSIAVADVLLAPFCEEVSYELYRMEQNTRLSFLKWINKGGLPILDAENIVNNIAWFVEQYMDTPNETNLREGYRYVADQQMEARSYYDPFTVANQYIRKVNEAKTESEKLIAINKIIKQKEKEFYGNFPKQALTGHFNNRELEITKHVIQENTETIKELITRHPQLFIENKNGISIKTHSDKASAKVLTIPKEQQEMIEKVEATLSSKTFIWIIPCSKRDIENCLLFKSTIEKIYSGVDKEVLLFEKRLNARDLLSFQQDFPKVTPADNLVIYISVSESSSNRGKLQVHYYDFVISEDEVAGMFDAISPASFTLILDGPDITSANHLIDTTKDGYAIIAFNDAKRIRKGASHSFTRTLCNALEQNNGHSSYRNIYKNLVQEFQGAESFPMVFSNRTTYYKKFSGFDRLKSEIQHKLRLCGYLNSESEVWDDDTEIALEQFIKNTDTSSNLVDVKNALDGQLRKNEGEQKPILMFLFSNNIHSLNPLSEISGEIAALNTSLKQSAVARHCEIKVFHNRRLQEIDQFVKKTDNRNRIQMIYYSGYDDNGSPLFNDGVIDLPKWSEWIQFHDKIELVFLSTCRSAKLAEQLTNIGVAMAIGSEDVIMDDKAAEQGINIIRGIASQNSNILSSNTNDYVNWAR